MTEFAVGTAESDEPLWHLKSSTPGGNPADELAIVYGRVPPGFDQIFPPDDGDPKPLESGPNYRVAAVGGDHLYRVVFALPPTTVSAPGARR